MHNHLLNCRHTAKNLTFEIIQEINTLRNVITDHVKLTEHINQKFKKNFAVDIIRYQIKKLKDAEYGQASEDAEKLVELLTQDANNRQYFFKKTVLANNQLSNVCFMTKKMIHLANIHSDLMIIDSSHKTNRFNMPLLDIIIIDKFGKSCTCFIALIADLKIESYLWALERYKEKLYSDPLVIFSDEEEALIQAIDKTFPQTNRHLCAWHVQQNLKKRSVYLNRGNKEENKKLYNIIRNLPFCEDEDDYFEKFNSLVRSKMINNQLKDYLKQRHINRERWVKCYFKKTFTCGTCTSSRIESKHRVYKRFLKSESRLCEVFQTFKQLEQLEISKYKEEIKRFSLQETKSSNEHELIKEAQKHYGSYVIQKLRESFFESIHYTVVKKNNLIWHVKREQGQREVKLIEQKMKCSCNDDIFSGVPCRHQIAIFIKARSSCTFNNLYFNSRWSAGVEIQEDRDLIDPDTIGDENEKIENDIQNPSTFRGPGRPADSQRNQSFIEKLSKKRKKKVHKGKKNLKQVKKNK